MTKLQWISSLFQNDVQHLIESIDTVLFDIDGVLVRSKTAIPGSVEAVAKLRKLGKKIGFVTNNPIYPFENFNEYLKPFGIVKEELVTPNHCLLAYLEKIRFKNDIYVISTSLPKKLLREAGYNVIEYTDIQSTELEETVSGIRQLSLKVLEMCKNVGIVYVDFDFNCHNGAIQAAKIILNHLSDVQLLSGVRDEKVPMDEKLALIGGKIYIDGIESLTNKKAIEMAKPGQVLMDFIYSKFNISDSNRVLMVGDNVFSDIALGVNSGFKTCLVLSGVWKKDQVEDWKIEEELKPDYVAYSLEELYEKIKYL